MEQNTYDAMIRKRASADYLWEKKISKYTVDDVNGNAFSEYLRRAREAGRIDFEDSDVKTVLDKLELIEENYLLNAGAVLFCDCGIVNEFYDKAGCRVEFETAEDGFVVVFYWRDNPQLSGTAQKQKKTAQKGERINALLEYCKEPRDRNEMMHFLV